MEVDRTLIADARRLITGANVHFVKTWIFCYEMSEPSSPRRRRYEALLRDFVNWQNVLNFSKRTVESHSAELYRLCAKSDSVNRRVQQFLASTSD
jgi:hypothetical protein